MYIHTWIHNWCGHFICIYIGSDGQPHPKAEAGQGCNSEKTVYNMYIYVYRWSCLFGLHFALIHVYTYIYIYTCMLKDI